MMIRVVHYGTPEGLDPFDQWLRRQNDEVRARVQTRIDRVEMDNFGDHHSGVRGATSNRPRITGTITNRSAEMPVTAHNASEYLDTPEAIAAYLNAALEEMGDDPRLLMKAFRNVAEAQGGVTRLAALADLDRVALSRALSGQRNPRLDTLAKVSAACGVKLRFTA